MPPKGGAPMGGRAQTQQRVGPRRVGPRRVGPQKEGAPKGGAQKGGAPEGWGPRRMGPEGWGLKSGAPKGGGPKFRAFSSLSRHRFTLSVSLWVSFFLVEFLWCLKCRGPEMCTFGVLGLSCASPGGPVWWGRPGVSHDNPRAQTCTFQGSGLQNTTKIQPRKRPRETQKERNGGGKGKKKREILGGPAEGCPVEGGSGGRWSREVQTSNNHNHNHNKRQTQNKWGPGKVLGSFGGWAQQHNNTPQQHTTTHNTTKQHKTTTQNNNTTADAISHAFRLWRVPLCSCAVEPNLVLPQLNIVGGPTPHAKMPSFSTKRSFSILKRHEEPA